MMMMIILLHDSYKEISILNFIYIEHESSIVPQAIADDRPQIAQKVFKNREKSIGATGF